MNLSRSLHPYFMFAGTLPFITGAYCMVMYHGQPHIAYKVLYVVAAYALVIASFMAGVHWGQHLNSNVPYKKTLVITSNLHALALWFGFVLCSLPQFTVVCAFVFITILSVDFFLHRQSVITKTYLHLRLFITSIVLVSLLIIGLFTPPL